MLVEVFVKGEKGKNCEVLWGLCIEKMVFFVYVGSFGGFLECVMG